MTRVNIRLTFISLTVSLVILESVLRLIHFPQTGCENLSDVSETGLSRFDSELGWNYIPYKSTVGDYGVTYTFNQEGYRSDSISRQTDFTKPIILIIGDSMLFGHGLKFEDTFGYKLQKRLLDKYEVLNFAVQAYGTDQMYLMLQKVFPKYNPQFVIVNIGQEQSARDVSRDRREFYKCARFIGTKPRFQIKNDVLELTDKPQRYEMYDSPRVKLLITMLIDGPLDKRVEKFGKQVTERLMVDFHKYITSRNSQLLLIKQRTEPEEFMAEYADVLGVSINIEKIGSAVYLTDEDHHPNSLGIDIMIDTLMRKYSFLF